jgi:hypothetical protein
LQQPKANADCEPTDWLKPILCGLLISGVRLIVHFVLLLVACGLTSCRYTCLGLPDFLGEHIKKEIAIILPVIVARIPVVLPRLMRRICMKGIVMVKVDVIPKTCWAYVSEV